MKVSVTWKMWGYVDIPNAKTMEEAMEIFENEQDFIDLPTDGEYMDSSFRLSTDDVKEMECLCGIDNEYTEDMEREYE